MALPYDSTFGSIQPYAPLAPEMEPEIAAPLAPQGIDPIIAELEARIASQNNPGPVQEHETPLLPPPPMVDAAIEAEIMRQESPPDFAPPGEGRATFDDSGEPIAFGGEGDEVGEFAPPVAETPSFGVDLAPDAPLLEEEQGGALIQPSIEEEILPAPQELTNEALAMRALEQKHTEERERNRLEGEARTADAERKEFIANAHAERTAEADAKSEELLKRAEEIASRSVDQHRYRDSLSLGEKALGAFAILAGGQLGLISGRGGNSGLDFVMSQINQDIDEQRFNIENDKANLVTQKGLVADLYRQGANAFQAAETARLATYEAAVVNIDNRIAQLDPEGSQAVAHEMDKRNIQAAAQAQRMKIVEDGRKQARLDAEWDLEQRDTNSQIDKRAAEVAKINAEAAKAARRGTGRSKPKPASLRDSVFARDHGMVQQADGSWVQDPGWKPAESLDEREQVARTTKLEREVGPETLGAADIVDKAGNPILFQDKAVAIDVSQSMGATKLGLELIDEMLAEIHENGWSSDTLRSSAWQRAQTNSGALTMVYKDTEKLGALAGADIDIVNTTSGMQGDITGVRDPSAGLKQAAKNLERKMNHVIQGYRPEARVYKFKRRSLPPKSEVDVKGAVNNVGMGLRPDIAALSPSDTKRRSHVAAERERLTKAISRTSDPYGMRIQARDLAKLVEDGAPGAPTLEEAIEIATPLGTKIAAAEARKLGAKHRKDIQKLSVSELQDGNTAIPWLKELKRLESLANPASQHPASRRKLWDYMQEEAK